MKSLWLFCALLVISSLAMANDESESVENTTIDEAIDGAEDSVQGVSDSVSLKDGKFTISDGSRIDIVEKHFSLVPPVGWEVHTNFPNVSLLMQIPFDPKEGYQRTIQVMKFSGGVPIDEITGKDFENVITQKFSLASPAIEDYRIRNSTMTELEDGAPGILFYSEFRIGEKYLMQAHILSSSADHRFLLTYTDLAEHFEGENAGNYLTEAWASMISMKLESKPPFRLRMPAAIGFGAGFILLFILLFIVFRKTRAGNQYGELLDAVDAVTQMESEIGASGVSIDGLTKDRSIAAVAKNSLLEDGDDDDDDASHVHGLGSVSDLHDQWNFDEGRDRHGESNVEAQLEMSDFDDDLVEDDEFEDQAS